MMKAHEIFGQTLTWFDRWGEAHELESMDPDYRSNLIPFLRRSAAAFQLAVVRSARRSIRSGDDMADAHRRRLDFELSEEPETWLERQPLMQRLVELEQGRTIEEREATARRNRFYEEATGYEKITVPDPLLCPGCDGTGCLGNPADSDYSGIPCPTCEGAGRLVPPVI